MIDIDEPAAQAAQLAHTCAWAGPRAPGGRARRLPFGAAALVGPIERLRARLLHRQQQFQLQQQSISAELKRRPNSRQAFGRRARPIKFDRSINHSGRRQSGSVAARSCSSNQLPRNVLRVALGASVVNFGLLLQLKRRPEQVGREMALSSGKIFRSFVGWLAGWLARLRISSARLKHS